MADDRLSALDTSFLEVETPTAHMHVGWAAVFDPPEGRQRPGFDELLAHIGGRMSRAPRYRQRLAEVPLGAADPVWVDDPRFRVERHVRHSQSTDLSSLIDDVMSRQLRRDRPLWEVWVADRLADGRLAIVGKAHHCMVDGLAAVELATLLLDPEPDPPAPEPDSWTPAEPPGGLGLLASGLAHRAGTLLEVATTPLRLATRPREALRLPALAAETGRAVADSVRPGAGGSRFTGRGSPLRHLATARRPLDDLRGTARAVGASVNDVLLAAVAGGVHAFEVERGGSPEALKTMVPVSVRSPGSDGDAELGNRIAFVFVDLPCDEPDPLRRLETVAAEMGTRKESDEPEGADALMRLLAYVPRTLQHIVLAARVEPPHVRPRRLEHPRAARAAVDARLRAREAYPIVPMADSHSLSVGLTTVCDEAFLGVYVDRERFPGPIGWPSS